MGHYVAIDLGDGTTCAAYLIDDASNRVYEPNIIPIMGSYKEIPSYIGFSDDNVPYIGFEATQQCRLFYSNWKARPTWRGNVPPYTYKDRLNLTEYFMHEVLAKLKDINQLPTDTTYIIGVPSGWSAEDIDMYKEIAIKAGFPQNTIVIKESVAACLFAKKFLRADGQTLSDENIKNGVLTIDVGSSTTDITYTCGVQMENYGIPLGAKKIEEMLFQNAFRKATGRFYDLENAAIRDPAKKCIACAFRQEKEHLFSNNVQERPVSATAHIFKPRTAERYLLTIGNDDDNVTKEMIEQIINDYSFSLDGSPQQLSWRGHFRNALQIVKRQFNLANNERLSIVVTGGASRMYFVTEDIKKIFGEEIPYFWGTDDARSFSVVKGLALAGLMQHDALQVPIDIDKSVKSHKDDIENFIKNDILRPLARDVAKNFKDTIINEIENTRTFNTMNGLLARESEILCELLNTKLENFNSGENSSLQKCLELTFVKKMLDDFYKKFGRQSIRYKGDFSTDFKYIFTEMYPGEINYLNGTWGLSCPNGPDAPFVEPGFFASGTRHYLKENIDSHYSSGALEEELMTTCQEKIINRTTGRYDLPTVFEVIFAAVQKGIIEYKSKEVEIISFQK